MRARGRLAPSAAKPTTRIRPSHAMHRSACWNTLAADRVVDDVGAAPAGEAVDPVLERLLGGGVVHRVANAVDLADRLELRIVPPGRDRAGAEVARDVERGGADPPVAPSTSRVSPGAMRARSTSAW